MTQIMIRSKHGIFCTLPFVFVILWNQSVCKTVILIPSVWNSEIMQTLIKFYRSCPCHRIRESFFNHLIVSKLVCFTWHQTCAYHWPLIIDKQQQYYDSWFKIYLYTFHPQAKLFHQVDYFFHPFIRCKDD